MGQPAHSLISGPAIYKHARQLARMVNELLDLSQLQLPGGAADVPETADQGSGMDAGTVARLFDPFFRAPGNPDVEGTGLGMAIVRSIVEQHHGNVEVCSGPGAGTVVSVWLPVLDAAAGNLPPPARAGSGHPLYLEATPAQRGAALAGRDA